MVRPVSGSLDGTVILWEVSSGRKLHTLLGQDRGIVSLAFSSDGRQLITVSGDFTTRIWDFATGSELLRLVSYSRGASAARSGGGTRTASPPFREMNRRRYFALVATNFNSR